METLIRPAIKPETTLFDKTATEPHTLFSEHVRVYSRSPDTIGLQIRSYGRVNQAAPRRKAKISEAFSHASLSRSEVKQLIAALSEALMDGHALVDRIAVLRANGARFAVIEESDDTVTLQGWAGPHVVTKRDLAIRYEVQS